MKKKSRWLIGKSKVVKNVEREGGGEGGRGGREREGGGGGGVVEEVEGWVCIS